MKYLFHISALFVFVLSGCVNAPEGTPEEPPPTLMPAADLQENTPAATNPGEDVSTNSIEILGGNEESLREFIKQWLIPVYPDGTNHEISVYIGSVPKDMPYDLPIPDDARTVGSITGNWVDYQLLFDTSLTPEAVHEFYAKTLVDKGWHTAPTSQGQGGFLSQSDLFRGYCYQENQASLNVETPSLSETKTGIRLSLDMSPESYVCESNTNGPGNERLLPQLKAPKGAFVEGGGGGSSDRDAEITASIKTDLSPAELVEFYNQQLLDAGWQMQKTTNGDGAAWSNWTLKDEQDRNWFGLLMVMKTATDRNSLYALLRIEKAK